MPVQSSLRRSGLVLMAGALAVTLAACGGSTPAADTTSAPNATRPSGGGTPPGAFGTVAAVSGSAAQVQNPQNGQVTVNFDASTTFTDSVAAALQDVAAGSCVSVVGTPGSATGQITAKTVNISPAGANGCGNGTGGASRTPNPSRSPRPSGSNTPNNGARAFGTVSAVSATGFTTHGTNPTTQAAVDTTVTVDPATTYTKTVSATSAALVVGVCVAALGKADDTGAITAKSIAISKAGPNGCTGGFGRGGGRGGNG